MEKLLLFGATDSDYITIKQIASRLKIACERIEPCYHTCTLGAIESGIYKSTPSNSAPDKASHATASSQASESLLVICGLSDKRIDKLLFELRRSDAKLDYKAVLTPTNKAWTVSQLFLEMGREKAAYTRMQP